MLVQRIDEHFKHFWKYDRLNGLTPDDPHLLVLPYSIRFNVKKKKLYLSHYFLDYQIFIRRRFHPLPRRLPHQRIPEIQFLLPSSLRIHPHQVTLPSLLPTSILSFPPSPLPLLHSSSSPPICPPLPSKIKFTSRFDKKQVILPQGAEVNQLYLIIEGQVYFLLPPPLKPHSGQHRLCLQRRLCPQKRQKRLLFRKLQHLH